MRFASRFTQELYQLASFYAEHQGRSLDAVSGFVFGKGGFFDRLKRGADCRTATLQLGLIWFDRNWPADLTWPKGIARSFDPTTAHFLKPEPKPIDISEAELVFLQGLAHAPIWTNGKRPRWWSDMAMRAFIVRCHNQMSSVICAKKGAQRFGPKFPKKSAIHEFWKRLDALTGKPRRPHDGSFSQHQEV
ncbi:MAG: hypothetical protein ACK4FR_02840 [Tabrizicola sp.]